MAASEFVVAWPTLGDLIDAWIEHHCRVPDGFARRQPFKLADWQFWCVANHYRVREEAKWVPRRPLLNQAFTFRRSQIVAPQKTGKGPLDAAIVCVEAVGPSVFAGWAKGGEFYDCADNGCGCGWTFTYQAGEPKGIRHPSPLIQLTATSEDQVEDNIYRHLKAMILMGPLAELMKIREGFIRILAGHEDDPDLDRIDIVTASANSRLGNPISFAVQDESGLYTTANKMRKVAETQRRSAAGMGGRTIETTNAWDPSENSVAQSTSESRAKDVFRFHRVPPANLSYRNKAERHQIHRYVYEGSWWVDLNSIEAEAAELLETDPAQAERFFGNRLVQGSGAWMPDGLWKSREVPRPAPPQGTEICLGFDGSESNDWTAIRARTLDGFRFTPTFPVGGETRQTFWNPAEHNGQIPRGEVNAAIDHLARHYKIVRAYCDPRDWQSEIGDWSLKYGEKVFLEWATYRITAMHTALVRAVTDLVSGRSTHDRCVTTELHVGNARKIAKPSDRYILGKPNDHQKIDLAMADVLAWEAGEDARVGGWGSKKATGRGRVIALT